jgi:hypothetical protein
MDWRWTVRRLLISAFLVVHIGATVLWVLPECFLRQRTIHAVSCYILPLGLWQYWTMFAPDPVRDTFVLEAEVVDAKGLRAVFAFPKLADYTTLQGIPRFRHSKLAANLMMENTTVPRRCAARHALRKLNVPADAFPVDVELVYQVRTTPPPGEPVDPMTPMRRSPIATFRFASLSEVR